MWEAVSSNRLGIALQLGRYWCSSIRLVMRDVFSIGMNMGDVLPLDWIFAGAAPFYI